MYNILINAYSVSPLRGSEPGMGWNWIINLAKYCRLFVITESEWKDKIEEALKELPQASNIHFFYNELPEKAREMSRNQGDWRFYYYYNRWQKKTFEIAEKIISENHIDIIHQLNMIGYREPGYLWKIKGIPYVWGPVGGLSQFPVKYLKGAGAKENLTKRLKNIINSLQLKYYPRVRKAVKRTNALVAATSEGQKWLQHIYKKEVSFLNETGCYIRENIPSKKEKTKEKFKILWVGRFYFRKQLNLAMKTFARLKELPGIELNILGDGSEAQIMASHKMADELGLEKICKWHGSIPQNEVFKIMRESDIFFFSSLEEGTPHVVLEAIQNSLPVICFDNCGHGDSVDETIGKKIKVTNPEQSILEFSKIIDYFYHNRDELEKLAGNCQKKQKELSWDSKIKEMLTVYEKVLS